MSSQAYTPPNQYNPCKDANQIKIPSKKGKAVYSVKPAQAPDRCNARIVQRKMFERVDAVNLRTTVLEECVIQRRDA